MQYRLLSIACFMFPLAVLAQTIDDVKVLDEVVVNGIAKSTQTLDKQGVSFTLMDSAFIAKNNVRSLNDIAKYTPGIEVPQYGSRLTSSMYVRGVGSRINSPSVGVYYENIPLLFKTSLNRHYYNIGEMAVLRGPQGTLYGLNSEGGMFVVDGKDILLEAKDGEPKTSAHLGFSNHFGRQLEVGTIMPVADNLAVSFDVFYRGTDGYITNHLLNQKADDADEAGAKFKLQWQANDKLSLTLFSEFQTDDEHGFAYGETNILGSYKRNIFDTGLTAVYNVGKWRMQSTTSFQYLNDFMTMDQDYSPQRLMHMSQHQNGKAVSEEFNLKGNVTDKWRISTGLYAAHQWLDTSAPVFFEEDFTNALAYNITNAMKEAMGNMPPQMLATINADVNMSEIPGCFRTPNMNLGVFHESHFDFTKDFSATVGLRYDFNRQDLRYQTSSLTNVNVSVMGQTMERMIISDIADRLHHSFNQVLPKLSLRLCDWYFTVAKGYRAGGYNIQMFSDILQGKFQSNLKENVAALRQGDVNLNYDLREVEDRISYDPEFSWNYEFGGNSKLTTENSKLTIRYAAFYSKVRDLQLSVMASDYGFGRMMKNVGKSTSFGGELSISGSLDLTANNPKPKTENQKPKTQNSKLFYTANYSYTRTKFLDNKRVPFVPAHIVNASVGYEWGRYSAELNMNGRGKIYWDEENTVAQTFYTQFGARLAAHFNKLTASLWTRNMLNYRPTVFAFTSGQQAELHSQIGEPFMIGVDLHLNF